MSGRLSNKVALITGAGSGLGREMGLLFGKEGATVVINDIDADAGERTAAEIGNEASFTPGDVSNPDDVEDLFNAIGKTHGRLDVTMNSKLHDDAVKRGAEVVILESPDGLTVPVVHDAATLGLLALARVIDRLAQAARAGTLTREELQGGTITVTSTGAKGGVLAMTREIAVHYARRGIRANAICPGPIRTPLLEYLIADEQKRNNRLNHIPAGRFGEPQDIASAAVYLASEESDWVTGTEFVVDGGITAAYLTEP